MKKSKGIFYISLLAMIVLAGCSTAEIQTSDKSTGLDTQKVTDEYVIDESDYVDGEEIVGYIEESELSEEEIAGLVLMREEEKLARDVYQILGEKWGLNIFSNIAESEQTHTDAIKVLLDRYGIEDPMKSNEVGSFASETLVNLYTDLVSQGESSLMDAFVVGITIEDLNIKDLEDLSSETDNDDIKEVYANLARGSRNHMRAFYNQIQKNGGEYSAQYISQEDFKSIISSQQESGRR